MNRTRYVVALAAVLAVAACGGSPEAGDTTPSPQYEGPIRSTDTALGEQIFTDVCGACHAPGEGAPDLTHHAHRVAEIRQIVREGKDEMPPLGAHKVSDDQLEAVLAYMRSIQAAEE